MSADAELRATADRHLVRYGGAFAEAIVERAEGIMLYTTDGREILDFTSGQMSAILGHAHPEVLRTIREASEQVAHLHSSLRSPPVLRLAEKLARSEERRVGKEGGRTCRSRWSP